MTKGGTKATKKGLFEKPFSIILHFKKVKNYGNS